MSTTEARSASRRLRVGKVDMKLERPHHPGIRRRPIQAVLRAPGLEAGRRRRSDGRASHRPVHAPGFWDLGHIRQGTHRGRAGLGEAGLIVSDIEAAHDELVGRGIDASDVWHGPPFPVEARQPGVDPERASYGSFFSFSDPDGNLWLVQEVTTRLPGRVTWQRPSRPRADLEGALRRAEAAHVEHEKRTGPARRVRRAARDEDWPAWYASYMVAEQPGGTYRPDQARGDATLSGFR